MDSGCPVEQKNTSHEERKTATNTNRAYKPIRSSGHTCMSLRQRSFCSMVSTRTISLQRDTTCFSSYRPSPFSSNASSSSSTCERTTQNMTTNFFLTVKLIVQNFVKIYADSYWDYSSLPTYDRSSWPWSRHSFDCDPSSSSPQRLEHWLCSPHQGSLCSWVLHRSISVLLSWKTKTITLQQLNHQFKKW